MKITSRIVARLLLLGAAPAPLFAQAARAELTGQVTGADRALVQHRCVRDCPPLRPAAAHHERVAC